MPYSAEFRDRDTNLGLLQQLATLRPTGGEPGVLSSADLDSSQMEQLLALDTFRADLPKAVSIRDVWPLLLLACGLLFLADVFVRRVALTLDWVAPSLRWLKAKVLRGRVVLEVEQRLERLRSKKQEVAQSIDQRRRTIFARRGNAGLDHPRRRCHAEGPAGGCRPRAASEAARGVRPT